MYQFKCEDFVQVPTHILDFAVRTAHQSWAISAIQDKQFFILW